MPSDLVGDGHPATVETGELLLKPDSTKRQKT